MHIGVLFFIVGKCLEYISKVLFTDSVNGTTVLNILKHIVKERSFFPLLPLFCLI